ncbi:hypothetical protein, partial [Flintibacter sp.]|uniref:hypothetical protein n=1 Tax=Flintibacter sp. TaxID=1918624 RepID=UPI003D0D2AD2|nr:hypothetical protein [Flintibacter sp.]
QLQAGPLLRSCFLFCPAPPGSPPQAGRALWRVQVFCPTGKTLAQVEFTSPEHIKNSGFPWCAKAHHGMLGGIAQYPGMKAFFNLK